MKKFKFRFQTLLNIRAKELEKAELKVAEAQRDLLNAEQILNNLQEETKQTRIRLRSIISGGLQINVSRVNQHQNYIRALEKRMITQKENIKDCKKELAKKREEMLAIRQKKLMMEKIQENDYKKYLKEYEMQDLKMIDEIATNNFRKK